MCEEISHRVTVSNLWEGQLHVTKRLTLKNSYASLYPILHHMSDFYDCFLAKNKRLYLNIFPNCMFFLFRETWLLNNSVFAKKDLKKLNCRW